MKWLAVVALVALLGVPAAAQDGNNTDDRDVNIDIRDGGQEDDGRGDPGGGDAGDGADGNGDDGDGMATPWAVVIVLVVLAVVGLVAAVLLGNRRH